MFSEVRGGVRRDQPRRVLTRREAFGSDDDDEPAAPGEPLSRQHTFYKRHCEKSVSTASRAQIQNELPRANCVGAVKYALHERAYGFLPGRAYATKTHPDRALFRRNREGVIGVTAARVLLA